MCCCEFLMIEWWHEHSHTARMGVNEDDDGGEQQRKAKKIHMRTLKRMNKICALFSLWNVENEKKVKFLRAFIFFLRFAPSFFFIFRQPSASDERRVRAWECHLCVLLSSSPQLQLYPLLSLVLCFVFLRICALLLLLCIQATEDGIIINIKSSNFRCKHEQSNLLISQSTLPSSYLSPSSLHHDDNHKSFTRSPKMNAYTVHVKMKMRRRSSKFE